MTEKGSTKRKVTVEEPAGHVAKKARLSYADTITVVAGLGAKREHFSVHRDILCAGSPYFAATLDSLSNDDKTINIPEVSAAAFRHYVEWIYAPGRGLAWLLNREVESAIGGLTWSPLQERAYLQIVAATHILCVIWITADSLKHADLKNEAMDQLLSQGHISYYDQKLVTLVWTQTAQGYPLRKWVVDHIAAALTPDILDKHYEMFPADLYRELLKRVLTLPASGLSMGESKPKIADRLEYHEHAKDSGAMCI